MPIHTTPAEFAAMIAGTTRLAHDYLAELDTRSIVPEGSGAELERLLASDAAPEDGERSSVLDALAVVARHSRAQNGRFTGYVLGSGEPVGAAADVLASVLNQNVTAWRSAPSAVVVERTTVRWLARAVGYPAGGGSLTGGGSMASLMALAIAREAGAPANQGGVRGGIVYASSEVHMSIPKAIALLGLGRERLRLVEVDDGLRMRPDALERAIANDERRGERPIAVVASAGTVATGAVDPLEELAAVAHRHGLWLHVDGAYGALAAIAEPQSVPGLAFADSLSLDAHKWLYQAVDCGCLLYRDREASRRAFSHSGDYVRTDSSDPLEGFAFFDESMELSRRFRALRLWTSLRYHGLRAFRESIAANLAHARRLASAVARDPALELLAGPGLSIVCFRHRFATDHDARNAELLRRLNARGRVYLSNATVRGSFALRSCFTNHRTTEADVDTIVAEVRAVGGELV